MTRVIDAEMCGRQGVDWMGINFWPRSKRFVESKELASELCAAARGAGIAKVVGVFVNQPLSYILDRREMLGLDWVQCHGDENSKDIAALSPWGIKAMPCSSFADIQKAKEFEGDWVLFDTPSIGYGGSGQTFDWKLIEKHPIEKPFLIAGGLNPDNVGEAIAIAQPMGVDTASGVECAPGKKSETMVERFVSDAKRAR